MKYFRDGYLDFFINPKHKDVERLVIKVRNFQNDSLIDKDKKGRILLWINTFIHLIWTASL